MKARTFLTCQFHASFNVSAAVSRNTTVFWDVMLRSPVDMNRHFGGKFVSLDTKLIRRQQAPLKLWQVSMTLHGITSQ